jgi:two-component system, sensor histidine kinase and response regulator
MPIDWTIALVHVDGDKQLLAELAAMFAQDCPRLLLEASESIVQLDYSGLERTAHTLKGRLAFFGIHDLRDKALRLETIGRMQLLDGAGESLAEVAAGIDSILPEFSALAGSKVNE